MALKYFTILCRLSFPKLILLLAATLFISLKAAFMVAFFMVPGDESCARYSSGRQNLMNANILYYNPRNILPDGICWVTYVIR
jgi:hypothetical protein